MTPWTARDHPGNLKKPEIGRAMFHPSTRSPMTVINAAITHDSGAQIRTLMSA
jgi:hypothetical protein